MAARFLIAFVAVFAYANAFCFHSGGGVGEYHWACSSSIEMEACYARCNCWSDFPNLGGQITHEADAWCFQDACWCSYNQDTCPFGTLKTNSLHLIIHDPIVMLRSIIRQLDRSAVPFGQ